MTTLLQSKDLKHELNTKSGGFMNSVHRSLMLGLCLMMWTQTSNAQSVSVKDVPADQESTTIEIKKGKPVDASKKLYQVLEDTQEVSGDPAPLMKAARENWNKACAEWKKEVKELNTENKIISLSCGKPQCQTTTMETTCSSDAKSKIRVAITD